MKLDIFIELKAHCLRLPPPWRWWNWAGVDSHTRDWRHRRCLCKCLFYALALDVFHAFPLDQVTHRTSSQSYPGSYGSTPRTTQCEIHLKKVKLNEISFMVSVMIHDDSHTEQNVQVFQDINVRRHTISLDTDGRVREVTTLTQTGQPAHSGLAKTHDLHCRAISGKQKPHKNRGHLLSTSHIALPTPQISFHLLLNTMEGKNSCST